MTRDRTGKALLAFIAVNLAMWFAASFAAALPECGPANDGEELVGAGGMTAVCGLYDGVWEWRIV